MGLESGGRIAADQTDRAAAFPISEELWGRVAKSLRLTPREKDVIQGIFDNGTEAGIAKQLHLSTHTVHAHFDRLYRKLQVSNRTALTLRVFTEILAYDRARREPAKHAEMTGATVPH